MNSPVTHMYVLKDIAELLIIKNGIHEGYWNVGVEFQMGATYAAPEGEIPIPTAMIGVSRIGLQPVDEKHAGAVNAALVNPATPARSRAKRKSVTAKTE